MPSFCTHRAGPVLRGLHARAAVAILKLLMLFGQGPFISILSWAPQMTHLLLQPGFSRLEPLGLFCSPHPFGSTPTSPVGFTVGHLR
uniref:Uncharacterized protein n=1 Tax=Equus asinus asinus TaxID=83772 RepID=A0A8C4MZI1_EQUAS